MRKLMVLVLLFASSADAEFLAEDDVLRGLPGVYVLVEGLSKDAKAIGLTEKGIENRAELTLRRNRVPVLTQEERLAIPGMPYLYVNVNVVGEGFSIRVEVKETMIFERAPEDSIIATTWMTGSTGTHARDANYILQGVEKHIEVFCLAYLRANAPRTLLPVTQLPRSEPRRPAPSASIPCREDLHCPALLPVCIKGECSKGSKVIKTVPYRGK